LKVDAWGANTMRTEFSFLSSLGFEQLGFYRYYPYHYLIDKPVATLASYLRKQGYYTVCIQPHHAEFFGRAALFPQLGFDEFLDIAAFDENETFGPYIADKAVTQKILSALQEKHNKPCFIFAITMENHGPLHLEKSTLEDISKYYSGKPLMAENNLTVYLRHLANADAMIKQLTTALKKRKEESHQEATLCWYGDHIPSLPAAYAEVDFEDNRTDYFIWTTSSKAGKRNSVKAREMAVGQLAEAIIM
jgi:phosphoglycerol transferase MdoB-like AlkP superfamily enzyme